MQRIATINPTLNSAVQVRAEGARAETRLADEALARGEQQGPLHGVPFTLKDTYDVAGMTRTFDVLLSPVAATPALPHGTTGDLERLPGFGSAIAHNLTGWPAVSVRGGTSPEGLPIGLQIIAHPWREEVALAVAQQLETALGGW